MKDNWITRIWVAGLWLFKTLWKVTREMIILSDPSSTKMLKFPTESSKLFLKERVFSKLQFLKMTQVAPMGLTSPDSPLPPTDSMIKTRRMTEEPGFISTRITTLEVKCLHLLEILTIPTLSTLLCKIHLTVMLIPQTIMVATTIIIIITIIMRKNKRMINSSSSMSQLSSTNPRNSSNMESGPTEKSSTLTPKVRSPSGNRWNSIDTLSILSWNLNSISMDKMTGI
mmetsp:Transcript_33385/g.30358  ORF Transcript_33385/g.30358 Transcript_33385/m.30358 type:complete len:227 (+) Transcript_33385:1155-1835(+)